MHFYNIDNNTVYRYVNSRYDLINLYVSFHFQGITLNNNYSSLIISNYVCMYLEYYKEILELYFENKLNPQNINVIYFVLFLFWTDINPTGGFLNSWFDAQRYCLGQGLTIERDKCDQPYWTGVYRRLTPWINILGQYMFVSSY